ncbi:MAG: NUDIX hydrolase [Candidatus Pelagadaptatus aseana]|uniref:NUDIX hydrolase n=1 Tax=Candidatus Pelagadaptatus aseana TaxID=3120508 RepID=UPI0039B271E4
MTRENLPHPTVATVVEQEGRYLMVHEHRDNKWVYNQPAGHIENGEHIIDAAIRETLEETAWLVEPTAIAGISMYHAPNGISYLRTTLIAKPVRHHPERALDPDIHEAVWLSYEELLEKSEQMRSPIVLKVINDVRQGQTYPLAMLYEHR